MLFGKIKGKRTFSLRHIIVDGIMKFVVSLCLMWSFASCKDAMYGKNDILSLDDRQLDSLQFSFTHHYNEDYNFVVKVDTLHLSRYIAGSLIVDTIDLFCGQHVVVVGIITLRGEDNNTIWVKLAHDENAQGWINEMEMLRKVVPDNPISQFMNISLHMLLPVSLILTLLTILIFFVAKRAKKEIKCVLFNDIPSFYPSLLVLLVATTAIYCATIRYFSPDLWAHFYFHPTLNPLALPFALGFLICLIWLLIVASMVAIDEVCCHLSVSEVVIYLCSLFAICALECVIFDFTTQYYVGYILLFALYLYIISSWRKGKYYRFICGKCGAHLIEIGKCPYCGAINEE